MTTLFKITPTPPTTAQLEPGQEARFSFTVESLAAPDKVHEVMLQALLVGADGVGKEASWLVAGPKRTVTMSGGKTETVTITARPTAATPNGSHNATLLIADKDRPNDIFAESSSVAVEVSARPEKPTPPGKPWWLFAIIAGAVALIAGAVVLIVMLTGDDKSGPGKLGGACAAGAEHACDDGLLCVESQCRLIGGARCPSSPDLCASRECLGTPSVCAVPLGQACDPADQDVVPCPASAVCAESTGTCLATVGAPCKTDDVCDTGKCEDGVCAIQAPAVKAGDPCETSCPAPLQCSASTKRCVELAGRACTDNNQCITELCESGVCATPELLRNCTADGICGPDQKCIEVQPDLKRCKWAPGHSCTGDPECSSTWCNGGVCSRDDGKCKAQVDCPPPYICITSKQECRIPNGGICGGNAECDTGFCNNNRCAPSPCGSCPPRSYCNNDLQDPKCKPFFLVLPQGTEWVLEAGKRTRIEPRIDPSTLRINR